MTEGERIRHLLHRLNDSDALHARQDVDDFDVYMLIVPLERIVPILNGYLQLIAVSLPNTNEHLSQSSLRLDAILSSFPELTFDEPTLVFLIPPLTLDSLSIETPRPHSATVSSARLNAETTDQLTQCLTNLLIDSLPLSSLIPYQSEVAVPQSMFFGRQSELHQLSTDNKHLVLVGPRRGGKTCLVSRSRDMLNSTTGTHASGKTLRSLQLPRCVLIGMDDLTSPTELWDAFLAKIEPEGISDRSLRLQRRFFSHDPVGHRDSLETIRAVLQAASWQRLTLILDECEAGIAMDQSMNWRVFRNLKALGDSFPKRLRIVLVGYTALLAALRSHDFPLNWERVDELFIGPLDKESMAKLVLEPMESIKVRVRGTDDVINQVYYSTGAWPNLVQDVCREMLLLTEVQASSEINPEIVKRASNSGRVARGMRRKIDQVREPWPRLLMYLIARRKHAQEPIHVNDCISLVSSATNSRVSDADVRTVLDALRMYGILVGDEDEYHFANTMVADQIQRDISHSTFGQRYGALVGICQQGASETKGI